MAGYGVSCNWLLGLVFVVCLVPGVSTLSECSGGSPPYASCQFTLLCNESDVVFDRVDMQNVVFTVSNPCVFVFSPFRFSSLFLFCSSLFLF